MDNFTLERALSALPSRAYRLYHNDFAQKIMLTASLKSTPINVRCFLDPVEEDAASNSSAAKEMVDEGVDSPPSSHQMGSPTPIRRLAARQAITTLTSRMYTFILIVTNREENEAN